MMHTYTAALTLLPLTLYLLGKVLRRRAVQSDTALPELQHLGMPVPHGRKIGGTAVIAGGSVAGLAAARVCAEHFADVVVVEPEAWLEGAGGVRAGGEKRARVPQYQSLHGYQVLGVRILRKLFPRYDDELADHGYQTGPADFKMHVSGIPLRVPADEYPDHKLPGIPFINRKAFETTLRRCVKKYCPNVRFTVGSVSGISRSESHASKIAAVLIRTAGGTEEVIQDPALVIDCAGPIHAGLKWLREAGFGVRVFKNAWLPLDKLTIKYNPKMCYATAEWPLTPELKKDLVDNGVYEPHWFYTYMPLANRDCRNMMIGQVNSDILQVLCGGWGDMALPNSLHEIREFARSLTGHRPAPPRVFALLDVLANHAEHAMSEHIRIPPCTFVRYSKAADLPSNFIAVGDAVMRINPIFAQGCTKAMIGVTLLDSALRTVVGGELPSDFSQRFFKAHDAKVEPLWCAMACVIPRLASLTESLDYGWNWHVRNFLAPPIDMFAPQVVLSVLRQSLQMSL